MTTRRRDWWPMPVALGAIFVLLNIVELAFADGGWPQIVGLVLGLVLIGLGVAQQRGWTGAGR